ncbi:MAG: NAD(P)/FAD-dependent oxidoreductase [Chloroflexota bacterium]|nr:NAD(P)/FAD-dependent oxidoreductase [Chloroflexota bacterium]
MTEKVDVLIVGAGISGIAAAYYLGERCPHLSWTIVEGRAAIGGTWDFFRYPGVRSDSDMYTLGYRFRPWRGEKAIADGSAILQYLKDTAREFGIDRAVRFDHRVRRVSWSSGAAEWTVDIERPSPSEPLQIRCNFLFMCTGYYRYDLGYRPEWLGMKDFAGDIAHPQTWGTRGARRHSPSQSPSHGADRDDLDYAGKRVIVIGSGATAVTMAPALAERAGHVTVLQRSPSYVASIPARDPMAARLQKRLPFKLAAWLMRWLQILRQRYYYHLARSQPQKARDQLLEGVRAALGPDYDVERHFSPRYNPWDERLCLVPDNDLFNAIKAGAVSMVTDHIERFVEEGILLKSGEVLPADVIVTATGLRMKLMHGVEIVVDGERVELGDTLSYKGIMYSNIPNLASSFGYTNASWTLKAELICEYVCRLLNYMARRGYRQCRPRLDANDAETDAFISFSSGYVKRALADLPKQGKRRPWKIYQNYLKDLLMMRYGRLNDGVMEFRRLQQ